MVLRKSSVRGTYVRPPLHVSWDELLHFKHPRVSAVNRIASRTFRDKNNNIKADSFFRLNYNVYIDLDNRERARARDKQQRRPISLAEKHENFIATVRKRRSASEQEHMKRVTRKLLEFLVVVAQKDMDKKSVLHMQSCFFAN